jgi:hypothetical protein
MTWCAGRPESASHVRPRPAVGRAAPERGQFLAAGRFHRVSLRKGRYLVSANIHTCNRAFFVGPPRFVPLSAVFPPMPGAGGLVDWVALSRVHAGAVVRCGEDLPRRGGAGAPRSRAGPLRRAMRVQTAAGGPAALIS